MSETEDVWTALYEAEDDHRYSTQQPPARRNEARITETQEALNVARTAVLSLGGCMGGQCLLTIKVAEVDYSPLDDDEDDGGGQ